MSIYEWIMSHVFGRFYMWISCMNESCHVYLSDFTHEWIMSIYEWIMSHVFGRFNISISYMNESCHVYLSDFTHEWIMSHINKTSNVYMGYGISTLLKIIGLFCKRAQYKRLYSAKETSNLKEPTNHSHPASHVCRSHNSQECIRMNVSCVCRYVEYRLFYRALLQKRPIILRSLLIAQDV